MSRIDDIDARLKARLNSANASIRGNTARTVHDAPEVPASPAAAQRQFAPIDKLDDLIGVERLGGFSLKQFFSAVFGKHGDGEIEAIFNCGGCEPPSPMQIDSAWPKPWVFTRALAISVSVYLLFLLSIRHFQNANLLPGLILVGSFAVPVSTLVLFFELNVWRDISLFEVVKRFLYGGIVSIAFSLFVFRSAAGGLLQSAFGAACAGIVEEVCKVLALICVADTKKSRHILGGMLLGAAVGTGFAAFESAGYAYRYLVTGGGLAVANAGVQAFVNASGDFNAPLLQQFFTMFGLGLCENVITLRGLLAPCGHIVWTAIAGAALWRVKGADKFALRMLVHPSFLKVFLVPVILHMVWDCESFSLPLFLNYIMNGAIGWAVAFSLVKEGLNEVAREKAAIRGRRAVPEITINGKRQTPGSMLLAAGAFIVVTFFTGFLIAAGGAFFSKVIMPAVSGS